MTSRQPPHDIAVRAHANGTYREEKEKPDIAKQAEVYLAENPKIYALFKQFTWEMIMAGRRRIGARMVFERIRWETAVRGNDDFKLNNNYVGFLVRQFQKENPRVADVFETREGKHVSKLAGDHGAVS